jgi:hypothetical protein
MHSHSPTEDGPAGGAKARRAAPASLGARAAGLALRIEPTPGVASAVAVVGIPVKTNVWAVLAAESGNERYDRSNYGVSAVAFAAYEEAVNRLVGTPALAAKNRATSVRWGAHEGEFVIAATCHHSFSAARRCAKEIVRALAPRGLYKGFAARARALGEPADRAAFDAAAADFTRGYKALRVVLTGNLRAKPEDAKKAAESLAAKVPEGVAGPGGREADERPTDALAHYARAPARGAAAVAVFDVIRSALKGSVVVLGNGHVWYPAGKEGAVAALDARVDREVAALTRLKDPGAAMRFAAATSAAAPTAALEGAGPTPAAVGAALRSALK